MLVYCNNFLAYLQYIKTPRVSGGAFFLGQHHFSPSEQFALICFVDGNKFHIHLDGTSTSLLQAANLKLCMKCSLTTEKF